MKELRKDGPNCSTRHDNGPFGTEGAAGADGYRGGQRFYNGDFRLHGATTEEEGFKGFRNTVSANFFGTITSHKANNQSANHWNENDIITEMVLIRRLKYRRETLIEGEIRD